MGEAVVMAGPLAECLDAARKLAALGFVCGVSPLPPTSVPPSLVAGALSSPHVAACEAAELTELLCALCAAPAWRAEVESRVSAALALLPALAAASGPADAAATSLASALSALALCGAFAAPLRPGGSVRLPSLQVGTVVDVSGGRARVAVRAEGEARSSYETVDLERLAPLPAVPPLALPALAAPHLRAAL